MSWKHKLLIKDLDTMTGVCDFCGPVLLRKRTRGGRCGNAVAEQKGNAKRRSRGVESARYSVKDGFISISAAEKDRLWEASDKVCAICSKELNTITRRFDHCHDTGAFRGWLCNTCNTGLGMLGDSITGLSKALQYLGSNV